MIGSPTIAARVRVNRAHGQLAARLWDVNPRTRRQRLISRGIYRLDRGTRRILFQLNANGYRFAPGHTIRLELLGRDAPTFRPSDTAFSARVELTALQIPTRERASRARGLTRFAPLGGSDGD
jgi:predicted acyl esterase